MSLTLKDYQVTPCMAVISIATLTAWPYSGRHIEQARQMDGIGVLFHWTLAVLEAIPGGIVIAVIERIVVFVYHHFQKGNPSVKSSTSQKPLENPSVKSSTSQKPLELESEISLEPYEGEATLGFGNSNPSVEELEKEIIKLRKLSRGTPRNLTIQQGVEKARINMKKAILEHAPKNSSFMIWDEFISAQPEKRKANSLPLQCKWQAANRSRKGEDKWLISKTSCLAAVFDGHGGQQVSKQASEHFEQHFNTALMQEPNNVFSAFEVAGAQTQKDIDAMLDDGSTGVHCFLDPISGAFYTSTLGDSEAFLYRKNKSNIGKIIPLSCVRKWDSKYDSIRLALGREALSLETLDPLIAAKKIQDVVGKFRTKFRIPGLGDFAHLNTGIAVSRSYGDNRMCFKVKTDSESTDSESIKVKIIIQKTKITGLHVGSGDIVIIVSDGFTDYVKAEEMVKLIEDCTDLDQLADQLATYAKSTKHSHDDVTVLVGYIS